jgi:CheY-like chemotaxis protein
MSDLKLSEKVQDNQQRILVVEDDGASLMCLEMMLSDEGYIVDTASDLKSALEAADKNTPDLLLTDMQLPDGNGGELWKAIAQNAQIPAIALSGYNPDAIFEKTGTRFSGYLAKPIDFDKLFILIRNVFNNTQV